MPCSSRTGEPFPPWTTLIVAPEVLICSRWKPGKKPVAAAWGSGGVFASAGDEGSAAERGEESRPLSAATGPRASSKDFLANSRRLGFDIWPPEKYPAMITPRRGLRNDWSDVLSDDRRCKVTVAKRFLQV